MQLSGLCCSDVTCVRPISGASDPAHDVCRRGARASAAILGVLGVAWMSAGCPAKTSQRPRDREVAGRHRSAHLGVTVTFPSGWMHRTAGDTTRGAGASAERGSQFYQGESSAPRVALSLRMTAPSPGLPAYARMDETVMLRSSRGGAREFARQNLGTIDDCEIVYLRERMTGRCVGTLAAMNKQLRVYFFVVGRYLGSAVFVCDSTAPLEQLDQIVASMH